jgi:hypothetical protein
MTFETTLAHQRDALLARLEATLQQDDRVLAAWLAGSFGRGTADAWSDIDCHVMVRDDGFASWLASRSDFYSRLGHPVLVLPSSASEKGDYQGVLFAGPVFIDLAVHPARHAVRDADTRLLFERIAVPVRLADAIDGDERRAQLQHHLDFFWAMMPIALKYVGRGNSHRAVTQIDLLYGSFVGVYRLLYDPARREAGGAHWLHPERDAALIGRIPRLEAAIDSQALLAVLTRLMDEMCRLHPELAQNGVSIAPEAVAEIERFRDAIISSS